MPKIPTYQAGRLASEQTGVPAQDTSGVVISQAVTSLLAKATGIVGDALQKQKVLMQKAELSKKTSEFDSELMMAEKNIRQQYLDNPSEGARVLDEERKRLFNLYKGNITDQDVKTSFDMFGNESLAKGRALDQIWAFNENNKIIQKNYFDRITQDSNFAGQTDNFDDVIQKAMLLEEDRDSIYQAWGGVLEGSKVIDSAQESMVKSYFYGQLTRGNAFKVLKEIDDGRLAPVDGKGNGLISATELKTLRDDALRMAKAGKDDAAALALINSVQTNFKIDDLLKQPIATTEEQINDLSFQIAKKKVLAEEGQVSEDEIKVLEQQQEVLQKVRGAQLSRSEMYVVPDPVVEADMNAKFLSMFKDGNTKKPFTATLEEVFAFQRELIDNRDRMDPKVFKKLSSMIEKSFSGEINGFVKGSKFQTEKSWFGLGGLTPADKGGLSSSKKLRNAFTKIVSQHDPNDTNADLFEKMKFFYDDLDELLDINDAPSMEALSQEQLDMLISGAQKKMQLKKMGLPIYLGEKDVIYRGGEPYRITGFDNNGIPMGVPVEK